MKLRDVVAPILALMWAAGFAAGTQDDNEFTRKTLVGLRGVFVLVEELKPAVERAGVTRVAIQTDAELKLRLAGIRVLSQEESFRSPGAPVLYIETNVLTGREPWVYNVEVELQQTATLSLNNVVTSATTWGAGMGTGSVGSNDISVMRDRIKDQVDMFINAYLSANPKK
jgi:hypothetical protein